VFFSARAAGESFQRFLEIKLFGGESPARRLIYSKAAACREDSLALSPMPTARSDTRDLDQAKAGSEEALGRLLESLRTYLQLMAGGELDVELRAKVGASD
jgi:hypothetical protein